MCGVMDFGWWKVKSMTFHRKIDFYMEIGRLLIIVCALVEITIWREIVDGMFIGITFWREIVN